ncbi:MAG: DNA helicase RecQ [Flavobacteriales bacterium]|jgi:ATP-dependent DNA helicase RecQ
MKNIQEILKASFGYDSFRPLQKEIVETILSGRDTFVLMPTGGGKSLCYQIPALALPGVTIVISPLISLMKDQVDALKTHGIEAEFLNSSLSSADTDRIVKKCTSGEVKILYVSPEKALASANFLLRSLPISLIAIDEAHCISAWGHDFRPEYKELHQLRASHPNATMMALTATADRLTQKDILESLGLREPEVFISSFDRPNISLSVKFGMKAKDKLADIVQILKRYEAESGIIYCTSKKNTEALAGELQHLGFKAAFYHAGMSSEDRNRVQEQFINDDIQVVCATIAFGMGIDKSNVRFVLHYNLPKTIENYYQEIGRGGRDGGSCETRLYYSLGDVILLREFAMSSGAPGVNLEKLTRMQEYAESRICRRKILLNYFSENLRENCGNCDVCKNPPVHFDGTQMAQMAISAVLRAAQIEQLMTVTQLINCLRGSHNAEVVEKKLNTIKTYGVGKSTSYADWNHYVMQMIQLGALEILYEKGNTLQVTAFGQMIVKGQFTLDLIKQEVEVAAKETKEKRKSISKFIDEKSDLFETLRRYRKVLADLENVPPYIIFNDVTLHEMVEKLPLTRDEMLEISGMSEGKYEKYGNEFLDLLVKSAPPVYKTRVPVDQALSNDNLARYMEELQKAGASVNATLISKLLLGSTDEKLSELRDKVSFYGIIKDSFKPKELFDKIKPYVEPVKKQIDEEKERKLIEASNKVLNYYSKESLRLSDLEEFKAKAEKIFESEPVIAGQEEREKEFQRSGKRWADGEAKLLHDMVQLTNNMSDLQAVLQRSERSIRFALLSITKEG